MTDLCNVCRKPKPDNEWYIVGGGGGQIDFYCSATCFNRDMEPELAEPDPGEECGRWINGRLGPSCSKAGSEECDWDCPYSR